MSVKYFCDRCDKEKDIRNIRIVIEGKVFDNSFCKDCIKELLDILKDFYGIEQPDFVGEKGIY